MTMPETGDRIRVTTADNSFEGRMMPDGAEILTVKLDSGYNIGIAKKAIHELNILERYHKKEPQKSAASQNANLPKVSILHTGGTIASKVDYATGGVFGQFTPEEIIAMFPELQTHANISSRLMRNMSSDDLRLEHINLIAEEAKKEIEQGAQGIIVTMGTDNLAVAATGVAFALQNIPCPVLFLGAQRSSDRPSSDAGMNLLCATRFIAESDFGGVAVCMHETTHDTTCLIAPPHQTRKMHSSTRAAFKTINQQAYARIPVAGDIEWLREYPKNTGAMVLKPFKTSLHIGMLKSHVHMYASEVLAFDGFDGVILEGTGLGHMPITEIDEFTKEHAKIRQALKDLIADGTIVAMAVQTIYGQVNMNVYSPGRETQDLGVIGHLTDYPPETAFIKLAWLLSHFPKKDIPKLYATNIIGELTERRTEGL